MINDKFIPLWQGKTIRNLRNYNKPLNLSNVNPECLIIDLNVPLAISL